MFLYSDGIIFKFRFQKSRFIEEIGKSSGYFFVGVYVTNAQNWLWKKLKPAGMRPWFLNYAMFSDAESVVFKILTLAKGFLFNFFVLG